LIHLFLSVVYLPGSVKFIDGLTKIIFTLTISIGSLLFGKRLACALPEREYKSIDSTRYRYLFSLLSLLSYAATLVTYFLLPHGYREKATSALLFAFPGALSRYALSTLLNTRNPRFPFGTFTANMFGTALLAAFHVLTPFSPDIMQGLSDGYCGCLTTISTFAAELVALERERWKWRYGMYSLGIGQILVVLIVGVPIWTGNSPS